MVKRVFETKLQKEENQLSSSMHVQQTMYDTLIMAWRTNKFELIEESSDLPYNCLILQK